MYRAPTGDAAILFVNISIPSVPGSTATAVNRVATMAIASSEVIYLAPEPHDVSNLRISVLYRTFCHCVQKKPPFTPLSQIGPGVTRALDAFGQVVSLEKTIDDMTCPHFDFLSRWNRPVQIQLIDIALVQQHAAEKL